MHETVNLTVNVGSISATRQASISSSLIWSTTWASYAIFMDTSSIILAKYAGPWDLQSQTSAAFAGSFQLQLEKLRKSTRCVEHSR